MIDLPVNNPAPVIASAVPAALPVGSPATSSSFTGTGFEFLYTVLAGSQSVARFNLQTQTADATFTPSPSQGGSFTPAARWTAAQPGTDTTVAVDLGEDEGNAIYDIDPTAGTGTIRGAVTGPYTGSCLAFTNPADMFSFDIDTTGNTLDHYTVTSAGFSYSNNRQYTLNHFGCFKINGGLAFSVSGGVANPTPSPAVRVGTFALPSSYGYVGLGNVAPDASLQRTFFAVNSPPPATALQSTASRASTRTPGSPPASCRSLSPSSKEPAHRSPCPTSSAGDRTVSPSLPAPATSTSA